MSASHPTFIDLFAGIGGIRIAFEECGAQCVLSCEWDKWARTTYSHFFKDDVHPFHKDIRDIELAGLPKFDVLTGGFPCQPFSIAGVSKKNSLGRLHGFKDEAQGTLFFKVAEMLEVARPRAFLLENVKNLLSHDKGNTWRVIRGTLAELGYVVTSRIVDAAAVVPQHRERIFIIGYRADVCGLVPTQAYDWTPFWTAVTESIHLAAAAFSERFNAKKWPRVGYILEAHDTVEERYTLTDKMWAYLQAYKEKHRRLGNGFGYGLVDATSPYTRTISARYYKDGSEALVFRGNDRNPRRLTPVECARLQGFPEDFEAMFINSENQPVSDTQAYRQFGNSVCVPVVESIASTLLRYLADPDLFQDIRTHGQIHIDFASREFAKSL